MSEKIREDARNLRKLIREAEAVSDEVLVACARRKQAMVRARREISDILTPEQQEKMKQWRKGEKGEPKPGEKPSGEKPEAQRNCTKTSCCV